MEDLDDTLDEAQDFLFNGESWLDDLDGGVEHVRHPQHPDAARLIAELAGIGLHTPAEKIRELRGDVDRAIKKITVDLESFGDDPERADWAFRATRARRFLDQAIPTLDRYSRTLADNARERRAQAMAEGAKFQRTKAMRDFVTMRIRALWKHSVARAVLTQIRDRGLVPESVLDELTRDCALSCQDKADRIATLSLRDLKTALADCAGIRMHAQLDSPVPLSDAPQYVFTADQKVELERIRAENRRINLEQRKLTLARSPTTAERMLHTILDNGLLTLSQWDEIHATVNRSSQPSKEPTS